MGITKKFINELTYSIIGACIEVHKNVGPGLYEEIYHKCLEEEFRLLGLKFKSELEIKIPSFPEVITKLVPSIEYPGLTTLSGSWALILSIREFSKSSS